METLYLFSSARAMKQFFAQHYENDFLPNAKGIGEFLDFILRVENKCRIPPFLREFYLYRAICASNTQKLGEFAKNFTQFLQNSSFFLKFYDELCAECVQINALEKLDIYAFYDDHLNVLKAVFAEYQKLLAQVQFFDKYFLENYLPKQIWRNKQIGSMPYIVLSTLFDMKISFPPIVEQNKYVTLLLNADKKIELINNQLEYMDLFKKGLLQQMFV